MNMYKSYQFRLYPNDSQIIMIQKTFGCTRFVYNHYLEKRKKGDLTCFDMINEGENITFSTKGYGHGVGMSQYGACFMANNGADYKTILAHYYTGTNLKNL